MLSLRGLERIRTAVGAFAELSLATRPRDHFYLLTYLLAQPIRQLADTEPYSYTTQPALKLRLTGKTIKINP